MYVQTRLSAYRNKTRSAGRIALPRDWRKIAMLIAALMLAFVLVAQPGMRAAAQTSTPVPLSIDTNSLLSQVNTWTNSLDDVVFLGTAIAIAIALLTFIGAQILKAFRGGG